MQPDIEHCDSSGRDEQPSALIRAENSDKRIVLKSNWLKRLTRRKRSPCSDTPSTSSSASGVLPKISQNDFESNSRPSKHSIVYVFNKYLRFGPRQTLPNYQDHCAPPNHLSLGVKQPAITSLDPPVDPSIQYDDRPSQSPSDDQSIEIWLKSLSVEEATIYQAKIEMNQKGWYRGSMSRDLAQKKLQGQPDGSFLVRDSQTSGCHFTLSFRSVGITLHYRIENSNGMW